MSPKTAWNHKNVARSWKIDFPHLLLRDTPWWVNKSGIFVFFVQIYFCFPKQWKNCTWCQPLQKGGHYRAEYQHKNFAPEKCKNKFAFPLFLCICLGGIGKLFKLKTRGVYRKLNSQRCLKTTNISWFSKSNFGAFIQDKFSLCGITPNRLRFKSWLV